MSGDENTKNYYQRDEIPDDLLQFFEEVIPQPVSAVVFDPFAGSGTTLLVARQLGRRGVGLDLSYSYLHEQARKRLSLDALDA